MTGEKFARAGQRDAAVECARRAADSKPEGHYEESLTRLYIRLADFETARKRIGGRPKLLAELADAQAKSNERAGLDQTLAQLRDLGALHAKPNAQRIDYLCAMSGALAAAGDQQAAAKALDDALAVIDEPIAEPASSLIDIAQAAGDAGDGVRCLRALDRAQLDDWNVRSALFAPDKLIAAGAPEAAVTLVESLIKRVGDDHSRSQLPRAYAAAGRFEDARKATANVTVGIYRYPMLQQLARQHAEAGRLAELTAWRQTLPNAEDRLRLCIGALEGLQGRGWQQL
jgi:hypothetical protein